MKIQVVLLFSGMAVLLATVGASIIHRVRHIDRDCRGGALRAPVARPRPAATKRSSKVPSADRLSSSDVLLTFCGREQIVMRHSFGQRRSLLPPSQLRELHTGSRTCWASVAGAIQGTRAAVGGGFGQADPDPEDEPAAPGLTRRRQAGTASVSNCIKEIQYWRSSCRQFEATAVAPNR